MLSLRNGERIVYIGVVVAGLSAVSFADDYIAFGVITVAVGSLIAAAGLWWHRRGGLAPAPARS